MIDCDWYQYSEANRLVVVILICGISLTCSLFTNNKAISFIEQASDSDGFPRLADTVATVFPLTALASMDCCPVFRIGFGWYCWFCCEGQCLGWQFRCLCSVRSLVIFRLVVVLPTDKAEVVIAAVGEFFQSQSPVWLTRFRVDLIAGYGWSMKE